MKQHSFEFMQKIFKSLFNFITWIRYITVDVNSRIQLKTSTFSSIFQISRILIALPELTMMAKKLKASESIGKKEK